MKRLTCVCWGPIAFVTAISLFSCPHNRPSAQDPDVGYTGPSFHTFSSQGLTMPRLDKPWPALTPLPTAAKPWAGTVSHHLLAASLINTWFAELSRSRNIKLFIIISPRHWNQGVNPISLSSIPWDTGEGLVMADPTALAALKQRLGIGEDPTAFPSEHGVGTLLLFLHRHFPQARILPILVAVDALDIDTGRRLADAVTDFFPSDRQHSNFLLISTDFSHHHGVSETALHDRRSRRFLETLSPDHLPLTTCDNRTGLYVLARLAAQYDAVHTHILAHTDSFHLVHRGEEDITSYFFSFIHEP